MTKKLTPWLLALVIGIVNAIVFRAFEFLVNEGTDGLWNQLLHTDEYRWMVIPLAVAMSVVFGLVLRKFGEKRVTEEEDPLENPDATPSTLPAIGVILLLGLLSLLAGASLGPEATLMASSAAIGTWLATKTNLAHTKRLLMLSSLGALLVAFLGSLWMMLVPLLIMFKQQKRFQLVPVGVVIVAGVSAYVTLHIIDAAHPGYGSIPALPQLQPHDYAAALIVGVMTTLVALALRLLIKYFAAITKYIDGRLHWLVSAGIFGLVLGVFYLLGGQSIEFSGNVGTQLLVSDSARYGVWALLGLIIAKLMATAWSKAAGYRGGLIFPSIYTGVALGLLLGHVLPEWSGVGMIIGGVAGILTAATRSPIMSAIFVIALLPLPLLWVALPAVAGAGLGDIVLKRLGRRYTAEV